MRAATILAWVVIALMSANMIDVGLNSGMDHGAGFDTFARGSAADPWQRLIDHDLMSGLLLMIGWVVLREKGNPIVNKIAWISMILWWGNIVVAAYVLWALHASNGNWNIFFLGRRAGPGASFKPGPLLRVMALAAAAATAWYLAWGLNAVHFAAIPALGYTGGFVPVILSLLVIAMQRPQLPNSSFPPANQRVRP